MNAKSPNQEKPSLSEWRKQNPGLSINDYYKIFGTSTNSSNSNNYSNQYETARQQSELNLKKSNSSTWSYIFIALFVLIAFLSNPKLEDHRATLRIKLTGLVEKHLSENTDNIISYGLGKYFMDAIIDGGLKNVSSDNYLLFSLTKFNFASESKIIGLGVFGQVYLFEKADKEIVKKITKN